MRIYKILGSGRKLYCCKKCKETSFKVPEAEQFYPLPLRLQPGSFITIICEQCERIYNYNSRKVETIMLH